MIRAGLGPYGVEFGAPLPRAGERASQLAGYCSTTGCRRRALYVATRTSDGRWLGCYCQACADLLDAAEKPGGPRSEQA